MTNTPEQRTQENFNLLPGLLTSSEFRWWTGLSKDELYAGVRDGTIRAYQRRSGGYRKYFKVQAAEIAGFKL